MAPRDRRRDPRRRGAAHVGAIDPAKSIYTGSRIAVLSLVVGGFLFGFGMTLGSGCGSKTLIRIGGGSLKSLIVMVFIGISAFMTLKGLFALWRIAALDPVRIDVGGLGATTSDLPALLSALGVPAAVAMLLPFALALVMAVWVFRSREFRMSREMIVGGLVVGAVVVAGWYVTGHLGHLAEDPATLEERFVGTNSGRAESLSFIAPVAYLFELLVYWTDASRVVTFGIAMALGTIAGAAGMAIATRTFRWEGFTSADDLVHHIAGGILMGFGGITALGCTIGQGITGVSTLAIGSFAAFAVDCRRLRGRAALPDVARRAGAATPAGQRRRHVGRFLTMIVFELACAAGHRFEGWFASADEFARQTGDAMVRCPVCDTAEVVRIPSARVRVGKGAAVKRTRKAKPDTAADPERVTDAIAGVTPENLAKLRELIRSTENVGRRFPEEARKIHYEEVPARTIRGQASREETEALEEEGIEVSSLPDFLTRDTH